MALTEAGRMENAAAPADSAKKSRRFMEKASKSGLCHPKTKHFNPIAPPPKTSQWPSEGSRPAWDFVAVGQQFGRSTGPFSAEAIGKHPHPA
ncbi:hypothetical protein MesoLj113c_24530 [Mesorhizobium sp. 113-3-9]|nr:hypothetical protein MesoLj113c_24530 [Mesorhizobium sp. 113-3-9]